VGDLWDLPFHIFFERDEGIDERVSHSLRNRSLQVEEDPNQEQRDEQDTSVRTHLYQAFLGFDIGDRALKKRTHSKFTCFLLCRCDERLKTKVEESTRLAYTKTSY
jgi:hypothetical protein